MRDDPGKYFPEQSVLGFIVCQAGLNDAGILFYREISLFPQRTLAISKGSGGLF